MNIKTQMNKEIIKLSVLTFLAGFFCKLYDDLNDNNLFDYLLLDNKEYINEFLKAAHYILLTYVSSNYIYPLLLFIIPNIVCFIKDKEAFKMPYEYSGMIAFFILFFYLIIDNFEKLKIIFNHYSVFYILSYFLVTYIFETLICKNIEFGYKKLAIRMGAVVSMSSVLLINYCFNLLPDELLFGLWYIIGYCLTSCFFQVFLILKLNEQDKQEDLGKKN
jgi:hypothetical protein